MEAEDQQLSEAQISARFKQLQSEHQAIASKIGELEVELNEHNLVIGALNKLEGSRKCYRLIGGVLVERNVQEVVPAVVKNRDGIKDIIDDLREQMGKKDKEFSEFIVKYKIKMRGAPEDSSSNDQKTSGVLA